MPLYFNPSATRKANRKKAALERKKAKQKLFEEARAQANAERLEKARKLAKDAGVARYSVDGKTFHVNYDAFISPNNEPPLVTDLPRVTLNDIRKFL